MCLGSIRKWPQRKGDFLRQKEVGGSQGELQVSVIFQTLFCRIFFLSRVITSLLKTSISIDLKKENKSGNSLKGFATCVYRVSVMFETPLLSLL